MAFAADIALDSLRAAITAAPRFCTVCKGRNKIYLHDTDVHVNTDGIEFLSKYLKMVKVTENKHTL